VRNCVTCADTWRWRGLGKVAARLWVALADVPGPEEELAARLGISVRTVRRHLARLEQFTLAERLPAGRWRRTGDDLTLELAAVALGVAGAGKRQRDRHAAERLRFHARREARR
jgi:DNA-binding IclR family transcriptional regulator